MDLSGRVVVVTGASSGIGRDTCVLLSELGARVVLMARNSENLHETKAMLSGHGHLVRPVDLSESGNIPTWMKEVAAEMGPIAGLVHSAGLNLRRPVRDYKPADINRIFQINVEAAAMLVKGLRQKGVRNEAASTVLVASVSGIVGQAGAGLYSATKGALIAFVRSAAVELAPEKLRVNCVAPGVVETEMSGSMRDTMTEGQYERIEQMHPLGVGRARDVSLSVAFLLSDAAQWITGTTLVVDGGYTAH